MVARRTHGLPVGPRSAFDRTFALVAGSFGGRVLGIVSALGNAALWPRGNAQRPPGRRLWLFVLLAQICIGLAAAAAPSMTTFALLGLGVVLPSMYASPVATYALILLSVPSYELTFLRLGALDLKLFHITTMMALAVWLVRGLARQSLAAAVRAWDLPLVLITVWALTTLFWSPVPQRSVFVCAKMAGAILTYFVLIWQVQGVETFKRIIAVWVILCFVWSLVGLYSIVFHGVPKAAEVELLEGAVTHLGKTVRVSTLFGKPNDYAFLLSIGIVLAIAYLRLTSSRWQQAATLIAIVPMMIVMVGTFSRKSWIGLGMSLALIAVKDRRVRRATVFMLLMAAVALGMMSTTHYVAALRNRVLSLTLGAELGISERTEAWQAGMQLFWESPLAGKGAGAFQLLGPAYGSTLPIPHSLYVSTLVEYGMVGMALLVSLLLTYTLGLWRALRQPGDPRTRFLAFIFLAILVSVAFQAAFKTLAFTNPIFIAFIALLGAHLRMSLLEGAGHPSETPSPVTTSPVS